MARPTWANLSDLHAKSYTCGYCNHLVSSSAGIAAGGTIRQVYICSECSRPTYFGEGDQQIPGSRPGREVSEVPDSVSKLYEEARNCVTINAYTSSVLACRKLLMNIAVTLGDKEGRKFVEYIDYISDKGYVPPNGKEWVTYIKDQGNEATHEIKLKSKEDALRVITFSEMLLKFIFEYPNMVSAKVEE